MNKNIIKLIIIITICLLSLIGITNYFVDPFFHYRKPSNGLSYILQEERYQNNGIIRNFDYDAIIAGSSMAENFKTSELDKLFNTNSIKVTCSGSVSSYKEVNDEVITAYQNGKDLKMVVRSLDIGSLISNKDEMRYDESYYPTYLYDNNAFNDVEYLLNKQVFVNSVADIYYTITGHETTSFDDYANWMEDAEFGADAIGYVFSGSKNIYQEHLTEEERKLVEGNVYQNLIEIAIEHPETEFYYFFTPYSICYFDREYSEGELLKNFEAMQIAAEMMNEYENIKVFSFLDMYDYVCDLNNYRDIYHYSEDMNDYILKAMANDEHLLDKDNAGKILNNQYEYYANFDYASLKKD